MGFGGDAARGRGANGKWHPMRRLARHDLMKEEAEEPAADVERLGASTNVGHRCPDSVLGAHPALGTRSPHGRVCSKRTHDVRNRSLGGAFSARPPRLGGFTSSSTRW